MAQAIVCARPDRPEVHPHEIPRRAFANTTIRVPCPPGPHVTARKAPLTGGSAMRRHFFGLVVALSAAGLAAADDKAEATVKKGIEAHGGADALNKYKAGRFKMKGDMSLLGMDLEFTGDLAYSLPDRYRMEMTTEIMGMKMVIRQVVKGEAIKSTVNVGGMDVPTGGGDAEKEELKLAAAMQDAEQLTPLLDAKK